VTVFFGANDASVPGRCGALQHIPLGEFEENLRAIVDHIRGMPGGDKTAVLLLSPPPVDVVALERTEREQWKVTDEAKIGSRDNDVVRQYAAAVGRVAEATGSKFVDLFSSFLAYRGNGRDGSRGRGRNGGGGWGGGGGGGGRGGQTDVRSLLCDGLHLSSSGNYEVFKLVRRALQGRSVKVGGRGMELVGGWLAEKVNEFTWCSCCDGVVKTLR
jgi:lysophospholipase L1-like esterase